MSASAWAQQDVPQDTSFSIQLFQPAPGPLNFFAVESPEIGDDMKPAVGLMLMYARRPFVIYNCDGNECGDDISASDTSGRQLNTIYAVDNLVTADILGSFNFLKWFQVGLAIPMNIYQDGQGFTTQYDGATGANWLEPGEDYSTPFSMGDLRIHLKARFIGKDRQDGPSLAVAVIPTLPLWDWIGRGKSTDTTANDAHGYGGDSFLTVHAPKILFGWRFGALRFALNAGVIWRKRAEILNAQVGHMLTYGGALGYSVIPEVELIAEVYGSKSLVSDSFTDTESAPLLFMGGGRFVAGDFTFHVAGGGGILSGVGVPQFQVVAGAAWTPKAEKKEEEFVINEWDIDGDGVDNTADGCTDQPEDKDGFQDEDGCPDTDNDNDTIVDGYDSCPMEAEDKDGFRDDDGCPDLDHDEDGIKSPDDKCPDNAEDFDEFEDVDGCPDADNDKDGALDAEDFCPSDAEDVDGFEDKDGCPDLDNDNDGVPDSTDKCPNEAEVLNGIKDDDGCPDKGKALVIVTEERIELQEMIQFKTNSDVIMGKKSFEVLDIVAKILKANTVIRISIEGHTDDRGNAAKNRDLSKRRSDAVKKYLVDQGVGADRLETVGWGPDKPIADNKTNAGRAANRRVEFIVIQPNKPAPAAAEGEGAAPAAESTGEGGMDFTSGGGEAGGAMDFTGGGAGEEGAAPPPSDAAPPSGEEKKEGGGEMDFTSGQ